MSSQCPRPALGRAPPRMGLGAKGPNSAAGPTGGRVGGRRRPVQHRGTGPAAHGLAVLSGHVTDRHHSVTNSTPVTVVTARTVHTQSTGRTGSSGAPQA